METSGVTCPRFESETLTWHNTAPCLSGIEASSDPTVVRSGSTGHLHALTVLSSFYLNRSWNSKLWFLYSSTQANVTGHVTKFCLGTKIYYTAYRLIYEYLSWRSCIIGQHDRSCKSNLICFSTYRYSQIRGHSLDVDTLHSRWVTDSTSYLRSRLLTTHTSRGAHSTFLPSLKKKVGKKVTIFNLPSFLNQAGDIRTTIVRVSHSPYSNTPLNAQDTFPEREALNVVIITLCKWGQVKIQIIINIFRTVYESH